MTREYLEASCVLSRPRSVCVWCLQQARTPRGKERAARTKSKCVGLALGVCALTGVLATGVRLATVSLTYVHGMVNCVPNTLQPSRDSGTGWHRRRR